jgi:hypothetical protein
LDQPGALGPPWTDAGADNGHGDALTGARLGPPGARAASRRTGDDREGSVVSVLDEREVRGRREGNESGERCGEARRGCSPFIGGQGVPGRKCRRVMAGDLQPTPLMAGEGVNGDSRGGIKAGE